MGWTEDTAKAIEALLEEKGISYRAIADIKGHSYNYWWKRVGSRETDLSLEDIEALCDLLDENPRDLLSRTRSRK